MSIFARILTFLCLSVSLLGVSQAAEMPSEVSYVIKSGDTLTGITKAFGLKDYTRIVRDNDILDPNKIYVGRTLVIRRATTVAEGIQYDKTQSIIAKKHIESPSSCMQSDPPDEIGLASWYGDNDGRNGEKTASGVTYDQRALTVAHPTISFGTKVCVKSLRNGKSVIATVNDRAPQKSENVLNVSRRIAQLLDIYGPGTGMIHMTVLGKKKASSDGAHLRKAVVATQRKSVLSDNGVAVTATPKHDDARVADEISPYMSEIVVTKDGPAHVMDGLNLNNFSASEATARLFKDSPMAVRDELSARVSANQYVATTLEVGERTERMLTAEGFVYENVLQAQLRNTGLPAKCYVLHDPASKKNYLLIREMVSGNWYGEMHEDDESTSCTRNHQRKE